MSTNGLPNTAVCHSQYRMRIPLNPGCLIFQCMLEEGHEGSHMEFMEEDNIAWTMAWQYADAQGEPEWLSQRQSPPPVETLH